MTLELITMTNDRIWEGTITVLALDLVRSAADSKNLLAFISVCVPPVVYSIK